MPLHRQVFLAAKAAAVGHQRHAHGLERQPQQLGDLDLVVVEGLALRQDVDDFPAGRQTIAGILCLSFGEDLLEIAGV